MSWAHNTQKAQQRPVIERVTEKKRGRERMVSPVGRLGRFYDGTAWYPLQGLMIAQNIILLLLWTICTS